MAQTTRQWQNKCLKKYTNLSTDRKMTFWRNKLTKLTARDGPPSFAQIQLWIRNFNLQKEGIKLNMDDILEHIPKLFDDETINRYKSYGMNEDQLAIYESNIDFRRKKFES